MNPPAAAALNPQAALYGNMPRLPSLSTPNATTPLGTATGLVRSPSIPMIPPQILAQLGAQAGGLPRIHALNPGLNINQLTQLAAANQTQASAAAQNPVTPVSLPAALANGLTAGVVSPPVVGLAKNEINPESEPEKKIEEINSNPASPENSESA